MMVKTFSLLKQFKGWFIIGSSNGSGHVFTDLTQTPYHFSWWRIVSILLMRDIPTVLNVLLFPSNPSFLRMTLRFLISSMCFMVQEYELILKETACFSSLHHFSQTPLTLMITSLYQYLQECSQANNTIYPFISHASTTRLTGNSPSMWKIIVKVSLTLQRFSHMSSEGLMLTPSPQFSLYRMLHCRSFTVVLTIFMEKGQTANESRHDTDDVMTFPLYECGYQNYQSVGVLGEGSF